MGSGVTLKRRSSLAGCKPRISPGLALQLLISTWWRHQMEIFSTLLAPCAGDSPVTGEFPAQRPSTRSFDVFFDLRLNKRFSKQCWGWWFEMPSRPLWRHCNGSYTGNRSIFPRVLGKGRHNEPSAKATEVNNFNVGKRFAANYEWNSVIIARV